ncbi:hypothetical protein GCM10022226_37870 [Sphaerisporangium flaviroseum]|uniref:Uncharacterized protein n=1 Tax=Sphaerisporangium flaviroseum TaxID=509199 RepID=A0ABP7IAF3_9ACTN
MRSRDLRVIVVTALCLVVAVGAFAFVELKDALGILLERPDPACVARSAADNERLTKAVAPHLPSVTPDDIKGGDGCGPPESGHPWIEAELPSASIEEVLRGFPTSEWTPIPYADAQKAADPGEVSTGVTGEVDERKVAVYAFRAGRGKGPVRVVAWFDTWLE